MTEQLELPLECKNEDHIWTDWVIQELLQHECKASRSCRICGQTQHLKPAGPSKLPIRNRFDIFLADFKASLRK